MNPITALLTFVRKRSYSSFWCSYLELLKHGGSQTQKEYVIVATKKVDILGKLDKGVKASRISEEYGITNWTVTYYKENREKIMMVASNSFQEMKRKTLHQGELPDLEQRLYD